MFYKEVDKRYKKPMQDFLKKHFRYDTMNSWNRSTSYANNIKLHNFEKPAGVNDDTWWGILEVTEWHERLSELLEDFGREHNWLWQVGINGRSGGYIVLYRGGIKPSGYKSYCTHCGQKNYQEVPVSEIGICGRCEAKARVNIKDTHMQIFTWPDKSNDMGEDFEGWSLSELRQRVELVQEFDKLSDSIVDEYVSICRNYRIIDEEILIPQTVKVLEPLS
jgi:hypothetical protein